MEGTKHDSQKIRLELLPWPALFEIAKVLGAGAIKYTKIDEKGNVIQKGEWNWALGMAWMRLIGAALRHIAEWVMGVPHDKDLFERFNLKVSPLACAGCCILFLITYELKELGTDDRPKIGDNK